MANVAKIPSKQLGFQAANIVPNVPCDASVYVGAVVRMSGGTAYNAIATTEDNAHAFGICESKVGSLICNIRVGGVSDDIFSGLDSTKLYFLSNSTAGAMQTTPVTTAGHILICIGQPFDSTSFKVNIGTKIKRA